MLKKINAYWQQCAPQLKQGAKIYLTVCLTLMALVGTYGLYLTKSTQETMDPTPAPVVTAQAPAPAIQPHTPADVVSSNSLTVAQTPPAVPSVTNNPDSALLATKIPPEAAPDDGLAQPISESIPAADQTLSPPETTPVVEEPERTYLDPTLMPGLASPGTAPITRVFGMSYDPIYQDYRYHNGVDYTGDTDCTIYAADDGMIQEITPEAGGLFTLTITNTDYTITYQHLSQATCQPNAQIGKNEPIGTIAAGQTLHFSVEK